MQDENGNNYLGGHDVKLDISTLSLKSLCVPFGVAIPGEIPIYEDVIEEDGSVSTYLVSDIVLWIGRYPELAEAIYDENVYFGQSMEVLFSNSEPLKNDPSYTDIIDFSFDALCLLNKSDDPKFNVEPCFPSASVKPITYSLNKDEFSSLMSEMKEQLKFCINNFNDNEGGKKLDEKNMILQKYNKTIEELDFSIEDIPLEEFENKMEELFGEKKVTSFSATYREKRDALNDALEPITNVDAAGNLVDETYFWIEDFSDEYVFVERGFWSKTDYETKYGRFSYTFDESNMTATISGEFEEMVKVWLTLDEKVKLDQERANYELVASEFEEYKQEHKYSNGDYEILDTYKAKKESDERKVAETNVFTAYEHKIGNTNEFNELKKEAGSYTIDGLKKECIYIIGLYSADMEESTPSENKTNETIKFSVDDDSKGEDKPYGGLIERYLNK